MMTHTAIYTWQRSCFFFRFGVAVGEDCGNGDEVLTQVSLVDCTIEDLVFRRPFFFTISARTFLPHDQILS